MNRHFIFSTAFGQAAVIYRQRPFKLVRTLLPRKSRGALLKAAGKDEWGVPGAHKNARMVSRIIINYFDGSPIDPPWQWMDLSPLTPLQQAVLHETARIPYGELRSYAGIARAVGRPRACRFVGTTMAGNPYPVLIPCHRVIRSDHTAGRFGGGTDLKKRMIHLEKNFLPAV